MNDKTLLGCICIAGIVAVYGIHQVTCGGNGAIFGTVIGAITGVLGYVLGKAKGYQEGLRVIKDG